MNPIVTINTIHDYYFDLLQVLVGVDSTIIKLKTPSQYFLSFLCLQNNYSVCHLSFIMLQNAEKI